MHPFYGDKNDAYFGKRTLQFTSSKYLFRCRSKVGSGIVNVAYIPTKGYSIFFFKAVLAWGQLLQILFVIVSLAFHSCFESKKSI